MPQYSIQQLVDSQLVVQEYKRVTPKELSGLVNRIKSHWGEDHKQWLPKTAQPQGPPAKWMTGMVVEISTLASLMSGDRLRATAVAAISQSQARRLAEEKAHGKVAEDNITARDVLEVRIKAEFVSCIKEYWVGDVDEWLPQGATNDADAFHLDSKILCGMALLAQYSSIGSYNRIEEVRQIVARKIEERTGSKGRVNKGDIFASLDEVRGIWLAAIHVNIRFYDKLSHRRTRTEKQAQVAIDNAAHARGSAHGTPVHGITISTGEQARKGMSLKMAQGPYWRIGSRRASMVPLHTDEKTAANITVIGHLEALYEQPLAIVLRAPELGPMEALAIPTELLKKIKTLAEEFALPLEKLHGHLDRKWQEKTAQMCVAVDNGFRSLRASDVEELIQETLRASPSPPPSPNFDDLFGGPAEDSLPNTPIHPQRPYPNRSQSPLFVGLDEDLTVGRRTASNEEEATCMNSQEGRAIDRSPCGERPRKRARRGVGGEEDTSQSQDPVISAPASDGASREQEENQRVQTDEERSGQEDGATSRQKIGSSCQSLDCLHSEGPKEQPRDSEDTEGEMESEDSIPSVQHLGSDEDRCHDLQRQLDNERRIRIACQNALRERETRFAELEALVARYRSRYGDLD